MKCQKVKKAVNQIQAELKSLDLYQIVIVLNEVTKPYGYKRKDIEERKQRYLSKIDLDPELNSYLLGLDLDSMKKSEVLAMCINKFGKTRSPSYTSLCRAFPKLLLEKCKGESQ